MGLSGRYLFTVAALVRARQIFCPTAFNGSRTRISRALTSAATTVNTYSGCPIRLQ